MFSQRSYVPNFDYAMRRGYTYTEFTHKISRIRITQLGIGSLEVVYKGDRIIIFGLTYNVGSLISCRYSQNVRLHQSDVPH